MREVTSGLEQAILTFQDQQLATDLTLTIENITTVQSNNNHIQAIGTPNAKGSIDPVAITDALNFMSVTDEWN